MGIFDKMEESYKNAEEEAKKYYQEARGMDDDQLRRAIRLATPMSAKYLGYRKEAERRGLS